jgi:hypothetical protein
MKCSSGAGIVMAVAIAVTMPAAMGATTEPTKAAVPAASSPKANGVNARRHYRNYDRYAGRPYVEPTYLDRPIHYRPYPYVLPVPFFLGFGFDPWW